ncbi:uncharacterized protein K452DRAFT_294328 [Aplosporella prunicola CBS 121167]|uniref:Nucleolar protein 12 n=1 Tax=Aplosporella prunicola CBS 121167 TaxID=1176127 RepID=A0A6A6BRS1_9PEZI|nr:uncharacterized protein K452DRAFT_294328 [Aplosporella prunicola CBS 121167]KAF2146792.1 hypothetical protein K452DRAFT_294328 [Aplosporella prunicola CBS 121167]
MAKKIKSLVADTKAVDPVLASLFAQSAGPIQPRPKSVYEAPAPKTSKADKDEVSDNDAAEEEDDEDLSSIDEELDDEEAEEEDVEASDEEMADADAPEAESEPAESAPVESQRKRKRKGAEEELEDKYMRKLAKEEAKEEVKMKAERNTKRQKMGDGEASDASSDVEAANGEDADSDADSDFEAPKHESLAKAEKKEDTEFDKAARTVFLGNVSTEAISSKSAKKTLLAHMSSFLSELPASTPPHKVESLRFRSTAYSTNIPKKGAYARKELMDATTKSTNAYVVYTTQQAAREAQRRLNGTVVLARHLRVDSVAHPAKADHRRCVFVGNLGFVDDESLVQQADADKFGRKLGKKKEPGDVEEGLWRQFGQAGTVESVRVVRDPQTRVGKGFAYVQFTDENGVEAALLFNEKRFPPLLPRKLRVVRAKAFKRNQQRRNALTSTRPATGANSSSVYQPKMTAEEKSTAGRAAKLLGKAGAAKALKPGKPAASGGKPAAGAGGFKTPESFVFEGHRATAAQGKKGLKFSAGKKKAGGAKPKGRSSKRAAAWKASGGKKA